MSKVILLSEADLRACVALDLAAVDCVEDAFRRLATEPVVMPPILRLDIVQNNGEVDVKTAYLPGLDSFAIKVSPGFFDNPKLGLPSLNGMMMLLSARTGILEALLLDNGYLTSVRTAAAGAVAARWLAREDARRAAVIGAGAQARLQLAALKLVRPIEAASVWSPNASEARRYADEMSKTLGIAITACADIDTALAGADVAITTTPSREPLIEARHLRPGLHITAMGSDAEHKNEIAPAAIAGATRYVCDRLAQVRVLGELHHAIDAGAVSADASFPELGQVIAGQVAGRTSADDVTICDLTGTGAQDTAIATFAFERARTSGRGTPFEA
ncbi:MAG: cyclodeaminase [Aromatoleum sp.]|jgi:ornithine cyclodeaminase|uniref:cyclodeaminase n=1 Tax=Aromatoleum sp. TaxID=2307007 RepID=UPI0028960A24|nr:cyclodeaminase [Aromatoleum sp.]MDT3668865.1 cyclodeaminase [Aromatoleum sp.]